MEQEELTYIKIPYPNGKDLKFKIEAPLCSLVIAPGIGNAWATGKYHDPKFVIPLSIRQGGNVAEVIAVNAFAYRTPRAYLPQLSLSFGRLRPFALSIYAGDIVDRLDLGGLPLSSLDIRFGAGNQTVDFSYPTPKEMSRMKFAADTGQIQIENVVNANVAEIKLDGDSTNYRLHFGGELKRNTSLRIGMSVASVEVALPAGTAVKITSRNLPAGGQRDGFSYIDKAYWNGPAREHQEPLLSIINGASDGALSLQPD